MENRCFTPISLCLILFNGEDDGYYHGSACDISLISPAFSSTIRMKKTVSTKISGGPNYYLSSLRSMVRTAVTPSMGVGGFISDIFAPSSLGRMKRKKRRKIYLSTPGVSHQYLSILFFLMTKMTDTTIW